MKILRSAWFGVLLLVLGGCESSPAGGADGAGRGDVAAGDGAPGELGDGAGTPDDARGDTPWPGDAMGGHDTPYAADMGLDCGEPGGYLVVGCPDASRPRLPELTSPTGEPCHIDMWFTYDRPAAYPPPICSEAPVLSWCFVEAAGGIEGLEYDSYAGLAAAEEAENWYPWIVVSGACQPFTVCDPGASCAEAGCPGCTEQTLFHATWLGWD